MVVDLTETQRSGTPTVDWGLPVEAPLAVLHELAADAEVAGVFVDNGVVWHVPGVLDLGRTCRVAEPRRSDVPSVACRHLRHPGLRGEVRPLQAAPRRRGSTAERPILPTCCRCASAITIASTTRAGPSSSADSVSSPSRCRTGRSCRRARHGGAPPGLPRLIGFGQRRHECQCRASQRRPLEIGRPGAPSSCAASGGVVVLRQSEGSDACTGARLVQDGGRAVGQWGEGAGIAGPNTPVDSGDVDRKVAGLPAPDGVLRGGVAVQRVTTASRPRRSPAMAVSAMSHRSLPTTSWAEPSTSHCVLGVQNGPNVVRSIVGPRVTGSVR